MTIETIKPCCEGGEIVVREVETLRRAYETEVDPSVKMIYAAGTEKRSFCSKCWTPLDSSRIFDDTPPNDDEDFGDDDFEDYDFDEYEYHSGE